MAYLACSRFFFIPWKVMCTLMGEGGGCRRPNILYTSQLLHPYLNIIIRFGWTSTSSTTTTGLGLTSATLGMCLVGRAWGRTWSANHSNGEFGYLQEQTKSQIDFWFWFLNLFKFSNSHPTIWSRYLDTIFPELFVPGESIASGEIKNPWWKKFCSKNIVLDFEGFQENSARSKHCVDSASKPADMHKPVAVWPCHSQVD